MTWAVVALTVVKIGIILGFILNAAALAVWADRRQGALIQHRVGPNRAVVHVPSTPMRIVVFAVSVLLAAPFGVLLWWRAPGAELGRMTLGLEVAVFVGWLFLLILSAKVRKNGADNQFDELVARVDPRNYFYGGLALHLLALPLVRALPPSFIVSDGTQWGPGLCGSVAAIVIMAVGAYTAAKLPDGTTPLRLFGTLHAMADTVKMIWKEDLAPKKADKLLFQLAPILAFIPALVTMAVLPFGSSLCFQDLPNENGVRNGVLDFGELLHVPDVIGPSGLCNAGYITQPLQIADLNVGLLFVFAIAGTGIIGAAIAGWASDNKLALLGGLRATGQMVSYEVAMGIAIAGVLMTVGSVHLGEIVRWQGENTWGIFAQPLGFFLFFAAVVAETKRIPFDLPEGESEIVAGYFLEYSGFKWGIFMVGEYVEFIFSSCLMVTLFFGGYHLPFLEGDGIRVAIGDAVYYELPLTHLTITVIHVLAFFGKSVLFIWFHVFLRWTLPRFRYDQLMKLGWTKLLPLSLANILLTGIILLGIDAGGAAALEVTEILGDLTQALLALLGLVGTVALVTFFLEPPERRRFTNSTAAKFAEAAGGVKPTEMQA